MIVYKQWHTTHWLHEGESWELEIHYSWHKTWETMAKSKLRTMKTNFKLHTHDEWCQKMTRWDLVPFYQFEFTPWF